MKNQQNLIGIGGLALGFLLKLLNGANYMFMSVLAYLLTLAGAAYLVYGRVRSGKKLGTMFVGGAVCIALSVLLFVFVELTYAPLPMELLYLLYLGGIALLIYSQVKAERDIDLRDVTNIKKNRNNGTAIGQIAVMVLGLLLVFYGFSQALTLLSILGIGVIGLGGFRLLKSLTAPDLREDVQYRENDDALSAQIAKYQNLLGVLRMITYIGYAVVCIAMIVLAISEQYAVMVVIAIAAAIFLEIKDNYESKLKRFVAENITQQALEEVFEVEEYKAFGHIDASHIGGRHFGIPSYDKLHGTDYMRGTYKGLPVEMCDMHLTERQSRTDDNGHTEEYDSTVFQGFWLICDFSKELAASLAVWERDKMDRVLGRESISTENETFNKKFIVQSEIPEEAFYILTPHMMEYILEMDKKANGQTHLRFDRNGKVQIAISTGRDGFEIGKKTKNATLLRKQFVEEIRYITDIIDELRLVDTLYKR